VIDRTINADLIREGIVRKGHFVYRSGRHSGGLIDRDLLLADPAKASHFGYVIAKHYFTDHIETVATPSIWGAGLAQWAAYFLEPKAKVIDATPRSSGPSIAPKLVPLLADRRVLLVDNLVISGETMFRFASLIQELGADIIGISTLWSSADPKIWGFTTFAALNEDYPSFSSDGCPLCRSSDQPPEVVPY
jgi:orotate phosphoribosyltransferase